MKNRLQWFGCYLAYKLYLALPIARTERWGNFQLWLLQYAGRYGYSNDFADFARMNSSRR